MAFTFDERRSFYRMAVNCCIEFTTNNDRKVFMDISKGDQDGIVLVGWWNLINKIFIGGTTDDFLAYLNH